MPRKTTEKEEKDKAKKVTKSASSKKSTKVASKKTATTKKAKTGKTVKKENENSSQKKPTAKTTKTKKAISIENPTKDAEFLVKLFKIITSSKESTKKTATKKKTVEPKPTKEKVATKKTTTTKKTAEKKATTKKATTTKKTTTTTRKKKKVEDVSVSPILEYYDLPYRYNETVVKLLAQTPNILFVYWDISDNDRQKFVNDYGEDFFQNTKPVLIVHNRTKDYAFEVEINDFANSWYLHVEDTKCDYQIEFGRRPRNIYANLPNNYLYISSSNGLESPNDHILFEHLSNHVLFQNVKTGQTHDRYMTTYLSANGKAFTIYELYQRIYGKELVTFNDRIDFSNPSSGNPSSTFR